MSRKKFSRLQIFDIHSKYDSYQTDYVFEFLEVAGLRDPRRGHSNAVNADKQTNMQWARDHLLHPNYVGRKYIERDHK